MEIKNIYTFLRAADLKSFTQTAQELGYSQSTISIQIKQLEKELGVPLFDRIGKKISLTPMGQEFLVYANEIIHATSKVKDLGMVERAHKGTLRLGILESLFLWKFSDLIPEFHQVLPAVKLETKSSTGKNLHEMLVKNELDLIFVLGKKSSLRSCIQTCMDLEKVVFVTSPDNPLVGKKNIRLSQLANQPMILVERDAIYRRVLDDLTQKENIEFDPFLEVDNLEIILKLVKKGMGISFLPEYSVRESLKKGDLSLLNVEDCDTQLWSQVLYHKNKWVTPEMKLFIKLIQENITGKDWEITLNH